MSATVRPSAGFSASMLLVAMFTLSVVGANAGKIRQTACGPIDDDPENTRNTYIAASSTVPIIVITCVLTGTHHLIWAICFFAFGLTVLVVFVTWSEARKAKRQLDEEANLSKKFRGQYDKLENDDNAASVRKRTAVRNASYGQQAYGQTKEDLSKEDALRTMEEEIHLLRQKNRRLEDTVAAQSQASVSGSTIGGRRKDE